MSQNFVTWRLTESCPLSVCPRLHCPYPKPNKADQNASYYRKDYISNHARAIQPSHAADQVLNQFGESLKAQQVEHEEEFKAQCDRMNEERIKHSCVPYSYENYAKHGLGIF